MKSAVYIEFFHNDDIFVSHDVFLRGGNRSENVGKIIVKER